MNEHDHDFGTLDLEDIIREFGGTTAAPKTGEAPAPEEAPEQEVLTAPQAPEEAAEAAETPEETSAGPVSEAPQDEAEDEEYDEDEEEKTEEAPQMVAAAAEQEAEDFDEDDEDEEVEIAPIPVKKPKFSLFGAIKRAFAKLLADEDEDEYEDEEEEEAPAPVQPVQAPPAAVPVQPAPAVAAAPVCAPKPKVTSDTIRLDDISKVTTEKAPAVTDETVRLESLDQVEIAAAAAAVSASAEPEEASGAAEPVEPSAPAEPAAKPVQEPEAEEYDDDDEDEVEFVAPQPIIFRPKSRLIELRRQLVAGPEKRYYELTEIGVGKLQIAMLLCLVVIAVSGGTAAVYAAGKVAENRMRLMIFGQVLAMLLGGLLGSQQMIEGVGDLLRGKFTLNTLLGITFVACCVDSVFCLMELRVPICAAFTVEVFMSLWGAYHKRVTEMGQMDSLRKAVRLDSVVKVDDYYEGKAGFLRGEGQVEDFMAHYDETTNPEKHQNRYALFSLFASVAVAVVAAVFHGISMGAQILCTTLLVAVPASFFVALTRPMAVLERKFHSLGTVLCGWSGVKGLCGKAAFALKDSDMFPAGSVKMNGVKFYGARNPDETIAYATALMSANGGTLAPIFEQLLTSRNGMRYEAENLQHYGNGGIGGEVCGEPVLMGTMDFLKAMGVEVPEGTMVKQAVYVSIDGELSGLFAVTYSRMKYSASGVATLCGYRSITPVVIAEDFVLTDSFLKEKFGVSTRRVAFPDREVRQALAAVEVPAGTPALALTTQEGLAPAAYAITGARALRTASRLGLIIHIIGGLLGILIMLALAIVGATQLLTPIHVLLYQLVWMLPGLLVTLWTRAI